MANQIKIFSNIDGSIEILEATRMHITNEDLFNDVATQKNWPLLETYEPESPPRGNERARGKISSWHQEIRDRNNIIILDVFSDNDIFEIRSFDVNGDPLVINNGAVNKYL